MTLAKTQMPEDQAVNLVRNALLVAGMEMGAEGDHWPVIKSTIHNVVKDWEDLKIERNVDEELKKHYGDIFAKMEKDLELCPAHLRAEAKQIIDEMYEAYLARFSAVDVTMFVVCDDDIPIHVKRAEHIVRTLENDHGQI